MSNENGLELLAQTHGGKALTDPEELLRYMRALLVVANADGRLAKAERQWVLTYAFDQGLSDSALDDLRAWTPEGGDLSEYLQAMDPTGLPDDLLAVRRSLLYDAMRAAAADGVFDADERAAIHSVAGQMGITAADIDELEKLFSAQ